MIAVIEQRKRREVTAWLNQDEVLRVGQGDEATLFVPALNETLKAKVTRIDRTSSFVDEQNRSHNPGYRWRAPLDRTAKVTLAFPDPKRVADAERYRSGLPVVVIFLGVLLIALVGIDAGVPGLVPGLRAMFRVPVLPVSKRRARLALAAGIGVSLVVCGALGARLKSRVLGEWELRQGQRLVAEKVEMEQLRQAREHLQEGDVALAELILIDAENRPGVDPEVHRQVQELLRRIERARDRGAILDVLVGLPERDFEALATGTAVPRALQFEERVLTETAVKHAVVQMADARAARAARP